MGPLYVPVVCFGTLGHTSEKRDSPIQNGTSCHGMHDAKGNEISVIILLNIRSLHQICNQFRIWMSTWRNQEWVVSGEWWVRISTSTSTQFRTMRESEQSKKHYTITLSLGECGLDGYTDTSHANISATSLEMADKKDTPFPNFRDISCGDVKLNPALFIWYRTTKQVISQSGNRSYNRHIHSCADEPRLSRNIFLLIYVIFFLDLL